MKRVSLIITTIIWFSLVSFSAFANEWKQGADGRWWYQHDDGSYTSNNWELIDGKYYYFDAQGWMLANTTTPDGKFVGADGAWTDNNNLTSSTTMGYSGGIIGATQQLENEVAQKSQAYSDAFTDKLNEAVQAELNRTESASMSSSPISTISIGEGITMQTGSFSGVECVYNVTSAKVEKGSYMHKLMVKLNIEKITNENTFGKKRGRNAHVLFTLLDKDGFEIGHINEGFSSTGEQTFSCRIDKNTARIEYRYNL